MNSLYKLLDKIESAVMDGIPIPLLPFTIINQDKLIDLLDKVHTAIPEEVQIADQIMNKRDGIIEEAQRKSQSFLEETKQRADSMINDSELLKAVREEAERIRQQVIEELDVMRQEAYREVEAIRGESVEEARLLRQQADEYANAVLKNLSDSLEEYLGVTQSGQKQLSKIRNDLNTKHQKQNQGREQHMPSSRLSARQSKKKDFMSNSLLRQEPLAPEAESSGLPASTLV